MDEGGEGAWRGRAGRTGGVRVCLPDNAAHRSDLLDVPLGILEGALLFEADTRSGSTGLNGVDASVVLVTELGLGGKGGWERGENRRVGKFRYVAGHAHHPHPCPGPASA